MYSPCFKLIIVSFICALNSCTNRCQAQTFSLFLFHRHLHIGFISHLCIVRICLKLVCVFDNFVHIVILIATTNMEAWRGWLLGRLIVELDDVDFLCLLFQFDVSEEILVHRHGGKNLRQKSNLQRERHFREKWIL